MEKPIYEIELIYIGDMQSFPIKLRGEYALQIGRRGGMNSKEWASIRDDDMGDLDRVTTCLIRLCNCEYFAQPIQLQIGSRTRQQIGEELASALEQRIELHNRKLLIFPSSMNDNYLDIQEK